MSSSTSGNNNNNNNNEGGGGDLILVVGSANQDLTSKTRVLPGLGETVLGTGFSTACGGKGANQAVAAASLKLAPVAMLCRVGDDLFGKNLLENFRKVGVDYFGDDSGTVVTGGGKEGGCPSGVASIVVDETSGDNTIVVSPGANFALEAGDVARTIAEAGPSQVLVQLEILPPVAFEALRAGKKAGATTILNTAPAPEGWSLDGSPDRNFFEHTDILVLNESELKKVAAASSGDQGNTNDDDDDADEAALAERLLSKGVGSAVIVTLGARGAMVVEKQPHGGDDATTTTTTFVDAPPDLPARELPVRNTVGAGDAFCGALAAYRSRGLSLADASGLACGYASTTVRKDGAQSSYPLYEDLPDCLKPEPSSSSSSSSPPPKRPRTKPVITFVTGNKKKLEEAQQILSAAFDGRAPFELTNRKIDLPELQGDTEEIAKEKCRLAAQEIRGAVFTEDTSLCFNALNGLPGCVRIALCLPGCVAFCCAACYTGRCETVRPANPSVSHALVVVVCPLVFSRLFCFCFCASIQSNRTEPTQTGPSRPYIKWFLERCGHTGLNRMLDGFDDRTAYAQTIVAYTDGPGETVHVFDGRTNGTIVAARGPTDFGWDPVFQPDEGGGKTYAEMTKDDKNRISHRGRSFEKFRAYLHSRLTSQDE